MPIRLSKVGATCSVRSAAKRSVPERSHIVSTNYLVLVPTDPDAHPADRHPRTRRGVAPGVACLLPKTEAARPATRWSLWTRVATGRVSSARRVALTCDTPEWGEVMSRGYRGGCGFVGPPAEAGDPGSHGHCVDDAFDLLDVLPFMASQPLRIEQHGPLEDLSRPRNSRRT